MVPHSTRVLLAALSLLMASASPGWTAPAIVVTGDWSPVIGAADLQSGAGSDLVPTLQSAANQAAIDITGLTNDSDAWRIDVRRTDSVWPVDFTLEVRRTSEGLGGGFIVSGQSYLGISVVDQLLCEGEGDRTGVEAQFRLGGISLQVPPDIYSTTVTWTLVDT